MLTQRKNRPQHVLACSKRPQIRIVVLLTNTRSGKEPQHELRFLVLLNMPEQVVSVFESAMNFVL